MGSRRHFMNNSNYGNSGGGGGGGGGSYGGGRYNGGPSGVSPWQSGTSPNRGSLLNSNLLNQLSSSDSQIALATQLLSSILPTQGQPPSLMSLAGGYGGSRYSGGNYGNDRFRRDDRRSDQNRNRRPNDRNRDRKPAGRFDKNKKSEDDGETKEAASNDEGENKNEETEESGEKKEHEGPLPGYEGIPAKLLHCHVCVKTMWNDLSFDTHVKGRNHRNKMRDLDDSYQIQTNLMRQIAAISLKLEEVRRGKRRPYPEQYCKMCDLHFDGMTMFAHRSTDEHQNLKRFIHPSCDVCSVDFQVRLEYDEHILTPGHLQQETKALLRREKFEKDPKYTALREEEAKLRLLLEEVTDLKAPGSVEISDEDKKLIESLGEEGQVPQYDPDSETGIAKAHVTPVQGFLCKVCQVFLLASETSDVHCRTQKHYESYVSQLKAEANKRAKNKESTDDKRKTDSNDEAVEAKRIKTEDALNGEANTVTDAVMEVEKEDGKEPAAAEEEEEEEPQPKPARTPGRRGRGRGRK